MTDKIEKEPNYFADFLATDIKKHTTSKKISDKKTLYYLSWSYAWAEVKKADPQAAFKIFSFENNLPYVYDPKTGYMVFTEVMTFGTTLMCFLPVMNGANKAMKGEPYTYMVKGYNGAAPTQKDVEAATMMDINKTIMRCLVKNIALHGLGLNLYSKEDLTDDDGGEGAQTPPANAQIPPNTSPPSSPPVVYPSVVAAPQVTTATPTVVYGHTDISVEKPVCPFCGKLMYVTKKADEKTGDFYLYCSGTFNKDTPKCKYTCSSNGNARSDVNGKFL